MLDDRALQQPAAERVAVLNMPMTRGGAIDEAAAYVAGKTGTWKKAIADAGIRSG
jgi:hypothetical protein